MTRSDTAKLILVLVFISTFSLSASVFELAGPRPPNGGINLPLASGVGNHGFTFFSKTLGLKSYLLPGPSGAAASPVSLRLAENVEPGADCPSPFYCQWTSHGLIFSKKTVATGGRSEPWLAGLSLSSDAASSIMAEPSALFFMGTGLVGVALLGRFRGNLLRRLT